MGRVDIVLGPAAVREIKKLSRDGQQAVIKAIEALELDAYPAGVEKIQWHPRYYRMRVGAFRIIYCPLSAERLVILVASDRKEAYRAVGDLDRKMVAAEAQVPEKRSARRTR